MFKASLLSKSNHFLIAFLISHIFMRRFFFIHLSIVHTYKFTVMFSSILGFELLLFFTMNFFIVSILKFKEFVYFLKYFWRFFCMMLCIHFLIINRKFFHVAWHIRLWFVSFVTTFSLLQILNKFPLQNLLLLFFSTLLKVSVC